MPDGTIGKWPAERGNSLHLTESRMNLILNTGSDSDHPTLLLNLSIVSQMFSMKSLFLSFSSSRLVSGCRTAKINNVCAGSSVVLVTYRNFILSIHQPSKCTA